MFREADEQEPTVHRMPNDDLGTVQHSPCRRHLSRTMKDPQHVDTIRVDAVDEPIFSHDELSNRRVVVLGHPPTAFREDAE